MKRTNIVLDEKLVKEALKLTQIKTQRELIHYALLQLVRMKKRKELLQLTGKDRWIGDLNEMRKSRV